MTKKMIFSGFGGQGAISLGQIVATMAMNKGKQVSWIPSYGAEMRGGTANCSVIMSDQVIGSPMFSKDIDILVAMNSPSIDKFLPKVKSGGIVIVNSSVVVDKLSRSDVRAIYIDATNIAANLGNLKVQNMAMLSAFLAIDSLFEIQDVQQALEQKFSAKYPKLISLNMQAIQSGLQAM